VTAYLSLDDLLVIAEMLGVPAVRDIGLLDAAAHRPRAAPLGDDAYPDLDTKAAALLESLARNHALVEGNQRLGWTAVVVFYRLNGYRITAPEDDAYALVIAVASGAAELGVSSPALARWRTPAWAESADGPGDAPRIRAAEPS